MSFEVVLVEIAVSEIGKPIVDGIMMTYCKSDSPPLKLGDKSHFLVALVDTAPCNDAVIPIFHQPIEERKVEFVARLACFVAVLYNGGSVRTV